MQPFNNSGLVIGNKPTAINLLENNGFIGNKTPIDGGIPFEDDLVSLAEGRSGLTMPASIGDDVVITLPCTKAGAGRYLEYVDGNGYLDIGGSDFTFCMWAKADYTSTNAVYIGGKGTVGTFIYGKYFFRAAATTGYLEFVTAADAGGEYSVTSDIKFEDAGWVFLRGEVDQTNNLIHFYINETEVGVGTSYSGTFPTVSAAFEFLLGAFSNSSGSSISVTLEVLRSDVQIYNRLLSSEDAALVYAGGVASNPRAYWASTDLNHLDISSNNYHLTGTNIIASSLVYESQGSKLSLDNGYSVYKNDAGSIIKVPNLVLDIDSTVTITDYTKESSIDGNSALHNGADSMLSLVEDNWDRSDTDNFTDNARNDLNLFYDSSNPKNWHSRETNQVDYHNWEQLIHRKLFVKKDGPNIEQIFSYTTNKLDNELDTVLRYIGMESIINAVTFAYVIDETDHICAMNGDTWLRSNGNTLYLSTDAGETWGDVVSSPIAIDPQFANIFDNGNILFADQDSIWLSTDNLDTFNEITPTAYGGGAYVPGDLQNYTALRFAESIPNDLFVWGVYHSPGGTSDVNIWYTVDSGATIKSAYLAGTTTPAIDMIHFHGIEYVESDGKFLAWTGDDPDYDHLIRGTYTPGTDTWAWEYIAEVPIGVLIIYDGIVYMNIEHFTDDSGYIKKVAYADLADTSKHELIYQEAMSMVTMNINADGIYSGHSDTPGELLISADFINFIKYKVTGGKETTEPFRGYYIRFPENNGENVVEIFGDDDNIFNYIRGAQLRFTVN